MGDGRGVAFGVDSARIPLAPHQMTEVGRYAVMKAKIGRRSPSASTAAPFGNTLLSGRAG